MGDRIRIGELLAAIGTIGLIVSLVALDWFTGEVGFSTEAVGAPAYAGLGLVALEAGALGWFAFATLIITLLATVVFFIRALTGRGPERAMLQGPIAYAFSGFTFLVLLVRLFVFQPGVSPDSVSGRVLLSAADLKVATVDLQLQSGAWIGLLSVFLIVVGLWFSMHDERTSSAAAKARTAELLGPIPVRPVPHVPGPPEPDASVVADDAIPTDPSTPPHPASGGPA